MYLFDRSKTTCLGPDVFKRVMEAVNNVDVGEFAAVSLPGIQAHAQMLR